MDSIEVDPSIDLVDLLFTAGISRREGSHLSVPDTSKETLDTPSG